jgi:hypothetical protein
MGMQALMDEVDLLHAISSRLQVLADEHIAFSQEILVAAQTLTTTSVILAVIAEKLGL